MTHEFACRLRLLAWAGAALASSVLSLVLWIVTVTAVVLFGVWLGIPVFLVTVAVTRRLVGVHRRVYAALFGYELPAPYLRPLQDDVVTRLKTTLRDPATWRDLAWLVLDSTIGFTLAVLGLLEAVVDLLFWFVPPGLSQRLAAWLATVLLGPTETSRLAARVGELATSRADTVDTQAAELRRIERDLHDGAQARLVSLGLTLALAETRIDDDPAAARALVAEARAASVAALVELGDLVRGIHPPVLADRGLGGALEALTLTLPAGIATRIALDARLPAPVESAAYFATAEALTNAVKHSGAQRIRLDVDHHDDRLQITVTDDGHGGADADLGSGLRGVRRRLGAFDGELDVHSPAGGPTRVSITVPCAPVAAG